MRYRTLADVMAESVLPAPTPGCYWPAESATPTEGTQETLMEQNARYTVTFNQRVCAPHQPIKTITAASYGHDLSLPGHVVFRDTDNRFVTSVAADVVASIDREPLEQPEPAVLKSLTVNRMPVTGWPASVDAEYTDGAKLHFPVQGSDWTSVEIDEPKVRLCLGEPRPVAL